MQHFKQKWEIDKNWQLIFPLVGIIATFYLGYKLSLTLQLESLLLTIFIGSIITFVILYISIFVIKKLESKWIVNQRWELIRIFIVFAITGSSSVFVSRPIIKLLHITKENLNIILYYLLYIFISLVFYQILLIFFGWAFGQFKFFWEFEKKMLRRLGIKII